jgi:S1-C subfamily serine protease
MKSLLYPASALAAIAIMVGAGVACSPRDDRPITQASTTTAETQTPAATRTPTPAGQQATATPPPATSTPPSTQATTSTPTPRPDSEMTVAEVVRLAEPSVVRIATGGGVGSGFIVSEDGYIVTNNHVVASSTGAAVSQVQVTLSDGSVVTGRVIGTDPRSDLAILKIDGGPYRALALADLDKVEIGQDVVAIGYALDLRRGEGPSFSVTRGIVSQKNRAIEEAAILGAIQTDAAINHGNSGGPLLSLYGEVVGVNTSLVPDRLSGSGVGQGIGLAVGSDTVKAVYEEIRANGAVDRGLLGVRNFESLRPATARALGLPEDTRGVYLSGADSIDPGGPAAAAGLRAGDVIAKIGDTVIRNETDLAVALIRANGGETVPVDVYRNGQRLTFNVTLASA